VTSFSHKPPSPLTNT